MHLTPLDEVLDKLLSETVPVEDSETVTLGEAPGRVCAGDVISRVDVPPGDNSAMDGYALQLDENEDTRGRVYPVSDRIVAGSVGTDLAPGTLARIFTGAELPPGANTVVRQEDTTLVDDRVRIETSLNIGQNVRPRGQDFEQDSCIVTAGTRLKAQHLGLIASAGHGDVQVKRRLRITIASTGSELVYPPDALLPGQIYNSNSYVLAALIRDLGMDVIETVCVEDDPDTTRSTLEEAADRSDCVITTGGVSVGDEDFVKSAVEATGRLDVWRIAIRPGKPLAWGRIGETPFFGLPGNPVASFVTFAIVARPCLLAMQGCRDYQPATTMATADFDYDQANATQFVRVRTEQQDNRMLASAFPNQSSGVLSSLTWANGLAEIEPGRAIKRGDTVKVISI